MQNFPALSISKIKYFAEGWDSVVLLINNEWLFRFPKRDAVATRLIQIEVPLLNTLQPMLPLAVPHFEFVARDPVGNIKPFVGYKMLPGEMLDDQPPAIKQAHWWRPSVAAFLTALHSFPVAQAQILGVRPMKLIALDNNEAPNENWRTALEDFYAVSRQNIYPLLDGVAQAAITVQFGAFLDEPDFFQFTPTLIHGDFNPEHVLLDPSQQRVTGVIDFGDVALGDPAYDLWEDLLAYYPIPAGDTTFEQRCHFYQKLQPLNALIFGRKMNDKALLEYGKYELQRLWLDSYKTSR